MAQSVTAQRSCGRGGVETAMVDLAEVAVTFPDTGGAVNEFIDKE